MNGFNRRVRAVAAVGLLAMVATAGCGDSDDDNASADGDPKQEISRVFDEFQDAFIAADGEAVCATLSAAGQQEFVALGKAVGAKGETCADAVDVVAARTKAAGTEQQRGEVVSVKVTGDRAEAMMRDGGRPPVPVPFVKDGDGWKLDSAGIGGSSAG